MRTSYSISRVHAMEYDAIYDRAFTPGRSPVTVIFCHGSGENATSTMTKPDSHKQMLAIAKNNRVIAADLGGQTWGNDTAISRIHEVIAYAGGSPVILVGASMGGCNALAYTRAHPENVLALALEIPLLSIQSIVSLGYGAEINAAYPPAYDDSTHGPLHSPIRFATDLPQDLPIKLWTSSNDPLVLPEVAEEFLSLRPQTLHADLGPLGHTGTAVNAATSHIVEFIREHI